MPNIPHARLRVGGFLYGKGLWSIGLNVGGLDGGDPFAAGTLDVQSTLEGWADAVRAGHSGYVLPGALMDALSTGGQIKYIRASRIGEDGKETSVALIDLPDGPKGSGTAQHTAQTSMCVTLLTARPGASYRGRFYLPALGVSIDGTNGLASGAQPTSISSDAAQWVREVADLFPDGVSQLTQNRCIVVSPRTGHSTPINAVRVGNRLDTQRRRADGQEEAYSRSAVAAQ